MWLLIAVQQRMWQFQQDVAAVSQATVREFADTSALRCRLEYVVHAVHARYLGMQDE